MPTLPAVFPHDRFFARLERFQCVCPSCGRLLTSQQDQGHLAGRKQFGDIRAPHRLVWNPVTQRLRCPWCRLSFVAGLLLYPAPHRQQQYDAPPDTTPTFSERMELRRLAGGWCSQDEYTPGTPVNVFVPDTCSCPAQGWAQECPLHGQADPGVGGK